jgi:hypothetical protein
MTAKVIPLRPEPKKPRLVWCRDEEYDAHQRIVEESIPYAVHTVEEYVDPSKIATVCGRCGGVTGAVEIYKGGVLLGRHTNPCSCTKRKRSSPKRSADK